jgi:hypothetical protein
MGTKYNPRIVTNGLVLCVDAGNTRSYSGTGLTANGLVGGIGGTLVNGVGFGSTNYGYFVFDGTNDHINFGNSSSVRLINGTVSAWVKTSSPGGSVRGIIAKQFAYGLFYNDSVLVAYDWGASATRSTSINIADGNWKNVVMSFQSGVNNGTKIYINGSPVLTTTITWVNDTQNLFGGAEASAGQYAACFGSIFSLYNRVLSDSEVLQNYNATKARYL